MEYIPECLWKILMITYIINLIYSLLAEHRNKKMTGKYGVDAFKCNALIVDSKFLLPSKEWEARNQHVCSLYSKDGSITDPTDSPI